MDLIMNVSKIRRIVHLQRHALGLTQTQFAQLIGVHHITVSRWERGVASPTPWQMGLISSLVAQPDIETLMLKYGPIHALRTVLRFPRR